MASRDAGTFAVVDVSDAGAPSLTASIAHPLLAGGEAVAYDAKRRRAFVASRTSAALVEIDVKRPAKPKVLRTLCTKRTRGLAFAVATVLAVAAVALHALAFAAYQSRVEAMPRYWPLPR